MCLLSLGFEICWVLFLLYIYCLLLQLPVTLRILKSVGSPKIREISLIGKKEAVTLPQLEQVHLVITHMVLPLVSQYIFSITVKIIWFVRILEILESPGILFSAGIFQDWKPVTRVIFSMSWKVLEICTFKLK